MSSENDLNRSHNRSQSALLSMDGWEIAIHHDESPLQCHSTIECVEYEDDSKLLFLADIGDRNRAHAISIAGMLRGQFAAMGNLGLKPDDLVRRVSSRLLTLFTGERFHWQGVKVQDGQDAIEVYLSGTALPLLKPVGQAPCCAISGQELFPIESGEIPSSAKQARFVVEPGSSLILASNNLLELVRKDQQLQVRIGGINYATALESLAVMVDIIAQLKEASVRDGMTIIWISKRMSHSAPLRTQ